MRISEDRKQKSREYSRLYRLNNKESVKAVLRNYWQNNKEKLMVKSRQYQKDNKDAIAHQKKNYNEKKKRKFSVLHNRAYIKRKYNITREEYDNLLASQHNKCKS